MSLRFYRGRGALAGGLVALTLTTAVVTAPHIAARAANGPAINIPANPAPAANAAPAEDIRDIRGPKRIANPWLIPALFAGAAVLALSGYGIWRWQRRRKPVRVLLPFEVALQRLEDIRSLMQPSSAREFSIAASDIVRTYIEERFEVTATHRTTEEFLHDLLTSANTSLAHHRGLLAEFLNQCDLVKFAGVSLSVADMEALHHSAVHFVERTAAPDPPVPAPRAAGGPAAAHTTAQ